MNNMRDFWNVLKEKVHIVFIDNDKFEIFKWIEIRGKDFENMILQSQKGCKVLIKWADKGS